VHGEVYSHCTYFVVLQALLACAPATLKAGEGIINGNPDENDAKLKLLYEYHVNDTVDVEFFKPNKL
jgi:hypothetical protein